MATDVDTDVAAALTAGGVPGVVIGPMRPEDAAIPDAGVFVLVTGGLPPNPYVGTVNREYCQAVLQLMVRSGRDDYAGGLTLARQARDAINLKPPAGYVETRVREAEPVYLGKDNSERHRWSMNVVADYVRGN